MKSSTDVLRELLDERGVEWWCGEDERKTYWRSNGLTWEYFNDENGDAWLGFLGACESDVTPEQAIAATLGDVPCLPHFWTHDGTLHIELPKLPESISVRLPDQRDREVGSARVWQYTRDSGTCHNASEYPRMFFCCSECGCSHKRNRAYVDMPRFCPNCGAKVVEPTANDVDAEVDA